MAAVNPRATLGYFSPCTAIDRGEVEEGRRKKQEKQGRRRGEEEELGAAATPRKEGAEEPDEDTSAISTRPPRGRRNVYTEETA